MTDRIQPLLDEAMADLLRVLELEPVGTATIRIDGVPGTDIGEMGTSTADVFVGQSQPQPHKRVFGGQVLAQSLVAASRTVADEHPGRLPHSLHAYFMRPGDDSRPIRFSVERMRDGRSFSTRRVHAIQHGAPILSMTASFQDPAGGLDHQDDMPDVPGPDGLRSLAEIFGGVDHPRAAHLVRRAVEHRHVEGNVVLGVEGEPTAEQHVWMRTVGELPDDPYLHAAVLAYASDYTLLEPVIRRHGIGWADRRLRAASLDHTMWFHRPVDPRQWLLYAQESPSAQGGRGLGIGRIFTQDGTLVTTIAQEGMLRVKTDD